MNNKKRKSADITTRIAALDDDKVVRSSTAGSGDAGAGKGTIELLQVQVANIEHSSDHSNTTINEADAADTSDTHSMRVILPVFIENEQKYAQMEQRRRKIHSSPAKTLRRFSQESSALEQQQRQQQHQPPKLPPPKLVSSTHCMCNKRRIIISYCLKFISYYCPFLLQSVQSHDNTDISKKKKNEEKIMINNE